MVYIEELDEKLDDIDEDDIENEAAAVGNFSTPAEVPAALKALSESLSIGGGNSDSLSAQPAANTDWLVLTASFGEAGSELGQFDQPWGITMLPDGVLCIAERGGPRLQVVDERALSSCGIRQWSAACRPSIWR